MTMASKLNSRSKGQRGEREVVKILQEIMDDVCMELGKEKICIQRNQNQSWKGGEDLTGLPWLSVEIKYQNCDFQNAWWNQCVRQAKANQIPVLFYRRNHKPWRVRLDVWPLPGFCMHVDIDLPTFSMYFKIMARKMMLEGGKT